MSETEASGTEDHQSDSAQAGRSQTAATVNAGVQSLDDLRSRLLSAVLQLRCPRLDGPEGKLTGDLRGKDG